MASLSFSIVYTEWQIPTLIHTWKWLIFYFICCYYSFPLSFTSNTRQFLGCMMTVQYMGVYWCILLYYTKTSKKHKIAQHHNARDVTSYPLEQELARCSRTERVVEHRHKILSKIFLEDQIFRTQCNSSAEILLKILID